MRAAHYRLLGCRDIRIIRIDGQMLRRRSVKIEFPDKTVQLPVWQDQYGTFVSTSDVRERLGVPVSESQRSEWFALDYIPAASFVT